MCGRYAIGVRGEDLAAELRAHFPAVEDWSPIFSMTTGARGLVLTEQVDENGELRRTLTEASWGITGAAWKRPEVKSINAREDNLFRVQKWRELYRGGHTALVPMSGYVEFVETSPKFKVPVFIHDPDASILTAAGLYDPEQEAFTILTMEAVLGAGEVHTRQPVFVPEEMRDRWLRVGAGDTPAKGEPDRHKEALAEVRDFSRTATERLEYHAIDRAYNNTRVIAADGRRGDPTLLDPSPEMQDIIDSTDFEPALSPAERAAAKKAAGES